MSRTKGSKNKKSLIIKAPVVDNTIKLPTKGSKSENPFEIMYDVVNTGVRGSTSPLIPILAAQVLKLEPGERRTSVNIPTTICPHENMATNLFLGLRRYFDGLGGHTSKMKFTSKRIYSLDKKKVYLGTRIWRIV